MNSVLPIGLKYWSANGISPQNDTIGPWHLYFCLLSAGTTLHMKMYPVFKPNAYFWEHHWSESSGEQKWEAYARIVREEIIAKSFDFKLSTVCMEDKFTFKDVIKGKKTLDKALKD